MKTLVDGAEKIDLKMLNVEAQLKLMAQEKEELWKERAAMNTSLSTKPFVSSTTASVSKVHKVLLDGTEVPPSLWRTQCGARFGFWCFTRRQSIEDVPVSSLCKRCFTGVYMDSASQDADSSSGSSTDS